jgi:ATP-binding cassette subfamily B protein/subfamily B ATP-binding cassette protein MsbA
MSEPARKLSDIFGRLQVGYAAADRLFHLLDQPSRIADPAAPRSLPTPHGKLIFEDVSFHYQAELPVLRNINLTISFGERIAIVGPNGCGKTTLSNLILRFYDPVSGRITIDGVDLREASLDELRRRIGIVTQQPVMFDDTVMNNLRYGSPEATAADVIRAAKLAEAHEFIESKLARGYDSPLGDDSHRLSGGQRQRLSLARALVRDPEILILDEATSQLDPHTERLIHTAAESFMKNRTTIIITHRPLTLRLADRILVMNAGEIVDSGTEEELASRCEIFQQLFHPRSERAA